MSITNPRFVVLDTATINLMADNPRGVDTKELISLLRTGEWIPFITYHHLEEIACHDNDDVFRRRFDSLGVLAHVAYLRHSTTQDTVGHIIYLRDFEIEYLAAHPGADYTEVIEAVRPRVRSGFCSGAQLVDKNLENWQFFRQHLKEETKRHHAEIANVTHFPLADGTKRIPAEGEPVKIRSERAAAAKFEEMACWLELQIREHGDCRNIDPATSASNLMSEAFQEVSQNLGSGERFFGSLMKHYGVERNRLPPTPSHEDVGYEAIFVGQLSVIARHLSRSKEELLRLVRKEQVPSWIIWQELDRRIKKLPNAEIGNVNDKLISGFGLYVDALNVDKRIADSLRQASSHNDLLLQVYKRVPVKRGIKGLLAMLRENFCGEIKAGRIT